MNKMLKSGLIFAAGLLIGAIADQFLMKKKFEERLDKELSEIKSYKAEAKNEETRNLEIKIAENLISKGKSVVDVAKELGYKDDKVSKVKASKPYAITAEEYGEEDSYNSVTLYYYTEDELVTDEADNEIDDVDEILGEGALDIFVYTNAESCFIRNDAKRCDYEVIKHEGSFEDYSSGLMGDEDG